MIPSQSLAVDPTRSSNNPSEGIVEITDTTSVTDDFTCCSETAFEWYKRTVQKQKQLWQNPIDFNLVVPPSLSLPASASTSNCTTGGGANVFQVTNENIQRLSTDTFFNCKDEFNELYKRLIRWRARKRNKLKHRRSHVVNTSTATTQKSRSHDNGHELDSSTAGDEQEVNKSNQLLEQLEDELFHMLPSGTGIEFIDQNLRSSSTPQSSSSSLLNSSSNKSGGGVMEITGTSQTAKTQILLSLAANYVAATTNPNISPRPTRKRSVPILSPPMDNTQNHNDEEKEQEKHETKSSSPPSPMVIILDPEFNVCISQLEQFVKVAVLRRWSATQSFRTKLSTMLQHELSSSQENNHHDGKTTSTSQRTDDFEQIGSNSKRKYCEIDTSQSSSELLHTQPSSIPIQHPNNIVVLEEEDVEEEEENHQDDLRIIEEQIKDALGRIHIVHPTDISSNCVAVLELVCQELDQLSVQQQQEQHIQLLPTTMILMDSVINDAFDANEQMLESLPNGNGLSGKHEFMRQLHQLRSRHNIFLASTRTIKEKRYYSRPGRSEHNPNNNYHDQHPHHANSSKLESWNKMITHHLKIERVLPGTKEDEEGFEYVALMPSLHQQHNRKMSASNTTHGGTIEAEECWKDYIPFSVTMDGISC